LTITSEFYIIVPRKGIGDKIMKQILVLALTLLIACGTVVSQFKSKIPVQTPVSESFYQPPTDGYFFGLFDPGKLTMNHSFSFSYMSFGGRGLSLGMYTNSLTYNFSDNLNVQTDVSFTHSPFSSFGNKFQKDLSGIWLSRFQINYRPWENTYLQFQFRQLPPTSYYGGYGFYDNYYDRYRLDPSLR
jgi:hypothetical protein